MSRAERASHMHGQGARAVRSFITTAAAAVAAAAFLALGAPPASAAAPAAAVELKEQAIVVQDGVALRGAPRDSAAVQAQLTSGDLLEVRGVRLDHVQVYDHRRERAGYVRADALRRTTLQPAEADELLAVLRFVRATPGQEALGIAFVAAYLQAAPAERITAEPFDALGVMAERLARRAAAARGAGSERSAAQLEAVRAYGVRFTSFEQEGRLQLCYDGEAFRRVLAMASNPEQQARAVLALTRHDCIDPALPPVQRVALDRWRAELLERLPAAQQAELPPLLKNQLQLRRAGVWAARAHQAARAQESTQAAGERALAALAGVDKAELNDEALADHAEAALRVGAARWAAVVPAAAPIAALRIGTVPGKQPGETCVQLVGSARDVAPLAQRCTFGTVWAASAQARPAGDALALAVQPLEGWTELWLFRLGVKGEWSIDVLPPAVAAPGLGYVEFAGWAPGAAGTPPRLLLARESRIEGRFSRRFEVLSLDTLEPMKQASTPTLLAAFGQHGDAQWRRRSVALR